MWGAWGENDLTPTLTSPGVPRLRLTAERLERQAARTAALRHPLYRKARLAGARRLLDVGCGNGAVTRELARLGRGQVIAVDHDAKMVAAASEALKGLRNVVVRPADAQALPFPDAHFDRVVCNLLLMWLSDPGRAVAEMARVLRPGGALLASMEPDYGGKIHWPESPIVDQIFQGEMIRRKGGDPHAGRKLRKWFVAAGLTTEVGLSNPRIPDCEEDLEAYHHERDFYRRALLQGGLTEAQVAAWEREYVESLRANVQLNYLPLFYAIGRKPRSRRRGPP